MDPGAGVAGSETPNETTNVPTPMDYRVSPETRIVVEVFNLFDAKVDEIDYLTAAQFSSAPSRVR